ncbi:efflux RND transporter permease subunit [Candidatus Albibeggiatoa sp. nov. NOAA]|uniref:efflux RND transporter permease subunit n=1 Tax=Candidatus Albibeggiatoa sp. nov. NOAA TaxID=3162724 RepID=UPI0033050930|nr:efflux RND transporter permease subunit [Thiotrichaceae bacterium]
MNLAVYSIQHRTVSLMFTLILLIGGIIAFTGLGRLEDPQFTIKQALVVTQYPGASPLEVEEEVTLPIENVIQSLPYVDFIRSISSAGLSQIEVEMKEKYDGEALAQIWDELRRKVNDLQPYLPPGVNPPRVLDDFGDVFGILLVVTGKDYSYQELEDYVDYLRRELVLIDGVGKVQVSGNQQAQVFVEISRHRLTEMGIPVQRIYQLLAAQNVVSNAGNIRVGREYIRINPTGAYSDVRELEQLIVSNPGAEQQIYLGDVATVTRGFAEVPSHIYRYEGERALSLGISFAKNVNVTVVGKDIAKRLVELEAYRPIGINIAEVYNQPKEVENSVNAFLINLGEAVLIVIGVLLFFMGLRSGILMGLILFITILGTFIGMQLLEVNLQRISLGALIIALGMLVDNAIVVTDGILVGLKRGLTRLEAAKEVVANTQFPLLGATIIAIMAFAPIGLSQDAVGEFVGTLFTVLMVSLFLSWVTAITLTPYFASIFFKEQIASAKAGEEQDDPYKGIIFTIYRFVLRLCLRFRFLFLLLMVGALGTSIYGFTLVKQSFFPSSNTPMFFAHLWLPEGTDIRYTEQKVAEIEKYLKQDEHVTAVTASIGRGADRFMLTYSPEKQYASYAMLLVQVDTKENIDSSLALLSKNLAENFPDVFAKLDRLQIGPGDNAKIQARINGPDPEVLRQLSQQVKEILYSNPYATNIRDDWREPVKIIRPQFEETWARRVGISKQDVDEALRLNFSGLSIGLYREGVDLLPIILRPPKEERDEVNSLNEIQIWSSVYQRYVPISQVVSGFETVWEDALVVRRDRKRTITIMADPDHRGHINADQLFKQIRPKIEAITLPEGYQFEWGGEYESATDAQASLFRSLPMGYLFMFMITVFLFDTLRQPLVIWATVPLAIIGVTTGMLVMNAEFGFMSLLGFLSLSGMLLKNGIVLVEQIKLEQEQGKEAYDAVFHASVSRVIAVFMAAITTILGLIPLLFDAFYNSMAVVIMFGLGFATVLTLLVIPVLYTVVYGIKVK